MYDPSENHDKEREKYSNDLDRIGNVLRLRGEGSEWMG